MSVGRRSSWLGKLPRLQYHISLVFPHSDVFPLQALLTIEHHFHNLSRYIIQKTTMAPPRQILLSFFALVLSILLTSFPSFGASERLLARRKAIPFGTPPSNALDSHSLAKRGVVVTWAKALRRGQASVCLLPAAQPASQWTQYSQLTQNGWNQDNTLGKTDFLPSDLSDALTGSTLSTSAAQWMLCEFKD